MTDREPTRDEADRIVEVEAEVRDNDRHLNQPCPNCGVHRADLQVFCGACGEKPTLDSPAPVLTDEERKQIAEILAAHEGWTFDIKTGMKPDWSVCECGERLLPFGQEIIEAQHRAHVASILAARVAAAKAEAWDKGYEARDNHDFRDLLGCGNPYRRNQ